MIFDGIMNAQLVRSQDHLLRRLLEDRSFAEAMSHEPLHACLGNWLSVKDGAKVLELGCGPGKYVAMLANLGFDVTGVDVHAFPSWDWIRSRATSRLYADTRAESLPFDTGSFDHVVCLGALLYFDEPLVALKEARRVLRPGGRLIVRNVNSRNLYTRRTGRNIDPASKNLYTRDELVALVERSGFSVTRSFSYGFWPPWGARLWWYLVCVWLPQWVQDRLSGMITEDARVNHVVFAMG